MTEAQAEARYIEALSLDAAGRPDDAEPLFRRLATAGHLGAMRGLADLLTDSGPPRRREGLAWYRRAADQGDGRAAWNCAMTWRLSGDRRRYLHWIGRAAQLGYPDAAIVLAEMGRRRLAGRHWPMFKTTLADIDAEDVTDMLQAFLDGEITAADLHDWADAIACGELLATPDLRERARLKPVLDELAMAEATPVRAKELLFAVGSG